MGLDNGIVMKRFDNKKVEHPGWVRDMYSFEKNDLDLAYWRRCWGLRNDFLRYIGCTEDNDSETILTVDHLKYMRRYIWHYMFHPNEWVEITRGYWEFTKYTFFNGWKMIKNLTWAIHKIQRDSEVYTIFYDSY